uniref:Uncharacterized protein n=1 Tax=Schistosoma haematobium TaxID=6185 RepID=A0A095A014_SCHHA
MKIVCFDHNHQVPTSTEESRKRKQNILLESLSLNPSNLFPTSKLSEKVLFSLFLPFEYKLTLFIN